MLATRSCPTLQPHGLCSLPGSSIHGVLQVRILQWVAISFSKGIFLTQRSNPADLYCRQIFTFWATREHVWKIRPCRDVRGLSLFLLRWSQGGWVKECVVALQKEIPGVTQRHGNLSEGFAFWRERHLYWSSSLFLLHRALIKQSMLIRQTSVGEANVRQGTWSVRKAP